MVEDKEKGSALSKPETFKGDTKGSGLSKPEASTKGQKGYDAKEVEEKWRKSWEKEKIYKTDFSKKKLYSIDTPPPTVSGKMHIGHAFSYSQQDFIVRFRRMKQGVFYPFGTDDNGLPTERLVEKLNKVKSKEMSREDFIKLCIKTLKETRGDFIQGWKNLGISCDYDFCYSTIDDNSRKISQKSFLELYKKGLVYRKEFPTIWCPECQTSIAQAELEDKSGNTMFSEVVFKVGGKDLLIATTRPELLGACVAIFVHPEDKRYKAIIGKKALVPLFNYEVPIIADKSADPEKGTGVLMICSFGDRFDVDAINRQSLKPRIILEKDGKLNLASYKGMGVKGARKMILEDLKTHDLLREQKTISHVVNTHDKCGTEIEFLPTKQWFIKILDKKELLIQQGAKIKWHPEFMRKRYDNWIGGLEWDWNISRERHFGVPIPVWYDKEGKVVLPEESQLPIDPMSDLPKGYKKGELTAEEKVLDTWATSSLTPQIASSLTGGKVKVPFSLRPQAHDIIRTWAFYTIIKSLYHENTLPWKDIAISGFVTLKGEKMSKSKGNGIDPKEVIEAYGADVLRYWAGGSKLGEDLDYQEADLVAGKKFINKLYNAAKFVFMNLEDYNGKMPKNLEKIDEEFLGKLNLVVKTATEAFEGYEYSKAKADVERFFWKEFCDNYLEIVKYRIYNEKGDKKASAQYALYKGLIAILKMIAPICPFITEEIYQTYYRKTEKDKSIHISSWPEAEKEKGKTDVYEKFIELLEKIRKEKAEAKKSVKAEIILTISKEDKKLIVPALEDFKTVTNSKEIREGDFKVEFV